MKKRYNFEKPMPIRMCIVCKNRLEQKKLHRFQIRDSKIIKYTGFGRSLYLCSSCFSKENEILQRAFLKVYKFKLDVERLKEIF